MCLMVVLQFSALFDEDGKKAERANRVPYLLTARCNYKCGTVTLLNISVTSFVCVPFHTLLRALLSFC